MRLQWIVINVIGRGVFISISLFYRYIYKKVNTLRGQSILFLCIIVLVIIPKLIKKISYPQICISKVIEVFKGQG
jgi:uncharacterized membrane protein